MAVLAQTQVSTVGEEYATRADFCRVFKDEMKSLYVLALLLTANHQLAEQCFVAGLADSREGNSVFKEWAHSWARRNILKNAIRVVFSTAHAQAQGAKAEKDHNTPVGPAIAAITRLAPIERFVFVMTALERHSVAECALLLNSTRKAVTEARMHALQVASERSPFSSSSPIHPALRMDTEHGSGTHLSASQPPVSTSGAPFST